MQIGLIEVTVVFASTRTEIASYVDALVNVYSLIIFCWILLSFALALGVRIPYSRWSTAILDFLRDVSEPYLRIFRRLGLQIGPLDLSPIVAIFVLRIVGNIVVNLIAG